MDLLPLDTTLEAARVQHEAVRRLTGQKRLDMACRMSDAARSLSAAGVRARHPEYDEGEVKLAVIRLCLGDELFHTAFPGKDIEP